MPGRQVSLIARALGAEHGTRAVLVDIDLTVTERSRMAVVGPNGVGKSTLLRVLVGELTPDRGTVTLVPKDTTVGLVTQQFVAGGAPTVAEHVAAAVGVAGAAARFATATASLEHGSSPAAAAEYDTALTAWLQIGAADFEARLHEVAAAVGLTEQLLAGSPHTLSGGEAARVGLAVAMLSRLDIVLLDEPTNDLDRAGLEVLEDWVRTYPGGLVVVSHDRAFLEGAVSSVLDIDEHAHTARLFNGGWQAFIDERQRARALAESDYARYLDERTRLAERSQQQREWAAQGRSRAVKAPADPDKHRKRAQIAQTEKLAGKAKATERAIERLEPVDKPWEGWELRFRIDEAPRSATGVAVLDRAVLQRGEFCVGPIDLEVCWAERVALTGPNGSGKTTIIDALLGRLEPASGAARLGSGVIVGELDQDRHLFEKGDEALLTVFQAATGLDATQARSVLAKFGLGAEEVTRPAPTLSPGERTRALLALFQARGVNLLVLDEPTNHLDLVGLEQLEAALDGYTGTLIVVSHDRRFLENITLTRHIAIAEL